MGFKKSVPLISWAFYDFANTIFSAIVLTSFFPLYLTSLTGNQWSLGAANTLSMIAAGLALPPLGALADRTGKTKSYLFRLTAVCVLLLFIAGFLRAPSGLIVCYIGATFCFHSALVFYNALLPSVALSKNQGKASGLGVGLGYLGTVIALPAAYFIEKRWGTPPVFMIAAAAFFAGSLPLFFTVPDRPVAAPISFRWGLWKSEWQRLNQTAAIIMKDSKRALFFGGHFLVADALNGTILWFMVYAREVFHPEKSTLILLLLAVNFSAFFAGIVFGFLTDKKGAVPSLLLSAGLLVLTLTVLSLTSSFAVFAGTVIVLGAFSIAGVWTSGRKVLIELSREDQLGEYFGLYGLTTKLSVLGSLGFSILSGVMGFRQALQLLIFPAAAGFLMLIGSAMSHETKSNPPS